MKVTNINPEFNGYGSDPFRIILVDTTEVLLHPVLCTSAVTLYPEETWVYAIQVDTQDRQANPLPTEYKVFGHVYCSNRESQGGVRRDCPASRKGGRHKARGRPRHHTPAHNKPDKGQIHLCIHDSRITEQYNPLDKTGGLLFQGPQVTQAFRRLRLACPPFEQMDSVRGDASHGGYAGTEHAKHETRKAGTT